MASFVLDASAILASLFADERDDAADRVRRRLLTQTAIVPAIWPLEILNALLRAERLGRLPADERAEIISDLRSLGIEHDPETAAHAWDDVVAIVEQFGLSPYDASYVELAQRLHLPLITRDKRMHAAVTALGLAASDS